MKSIALSHGAATIINAISTGKGAAFGIGLETKAVVELNDSGEFTAKIRGHPQESTKLIEISARNVIGHFGLEYGAKIETESDIPIARGLKSSSTAANSVVLATANAILKSGNRIQFDDQLLINLGVDAAVEAGVTITGAFDDASASYFGGFVVTDNEKRKILRAGEMESSLKVLLFVPKKKSYTVEVDRSRTKILSKEIEIAWDEALKGNLYTAMTINGILYSSLFKQDSEIALSAISAGAISAGLSGKGPAVVALIREDPGRIKDAWKEFKGDIIETTINNEKAKILG